MKKCPYCGEEIQDAAIKCRYCLSDLSSGKNVKSRQNKNRVFEEDEDDDENDSETTYQSNRLSSIGNLLFPDVLTLSSDGISFQKGSFPDSKPRHLSYRSVKSVRAKKGVLFYDVHIETSGRSQPILLEGVSEDEAMEIKKAIRSFQGKRDFDDEPSFRKRRDFDDE